MVTKIFQYRRLLVALAASFVAEVAIQFAGHAPFGLAALLVGAAFVLGQLMLPTQPSEIMSPKELLDLAIYRNTRLAHAHHLATHGDYQELLSVTTEAMERNPYDAALLGWRVEALISLNRIDEAARVATELLQPQMIDERTDFQAWQRRFSELGHGSHWINILNAAFIERRGSWLALALSEALAIEDRWSEVVDLIANFSIEELTEDPGLVQEYVRSTVMVAKAELRMKDFDGAESKLRSALQVLPSHPLLARWLGRTLAAHDKYEDALEAIFIGYRLSGDAMLVEDAIQILEDFVEPPEVLRTILRWTDELEGDAALEYAAGWLLYKYELIDEAVNVLQSLGPSHPYFGAAQLLLGELYKQRGHYKDAALHLSNATYHLQFRPFLWQCDHCHQLHTSAKDLCDHCGHWETMVSFAPMVHASYDKGQQAKDELA